MSDKGQAAQVLQAMEPGLMNLDDEAFVRQAYLRLLGRGADPLGLGGYLEQLQQGVSREEVYQALAGSEEAQRYEARRQQMRKGLAVYTPAVRNTAALVPMPQWWPSSAPVSWEGPATTVAHVNELLDLDGVAFIKAAYVALLGREVDADGGQVYLQRLRDGWSRMNIVKALSESQEGQTFGARLSGLGVALSRYRKAQRRSWGGWYYRSVLGVESDLPMERHLRATHLALRQS